MSRDISASLRLFDRDRKPPSGQWFTSLGERHARTERSRQKCLCRAVARILRRPNNYIPRVVPRRPPSPRVRVARLAERVPHRRPIFHRQTVHRSENFDTRGAARSFARSKLHPLRARHFNTSVLSSTDSRPHGTLARIPLLISRARVPAASPRDVSICASRANLRTTRHTEI